MCSIFKYNNYVGRNFDYESSYNEELRVVERNEFQNQYKIIGMCTGLVKDFPLLYDGMNEHGLVCGALAFQDNAFYSKHDSRTLNDSEIASYEFPLWILGNFKSVASIRMCLNYITITDKSYSNEIKPSDLHWFIADEKESIIVEQTHDGLNFYEGEVMTNNPPFPIQEREYIISKDIIGDELYFVNTYNTRGMESEGLDGSYTSDGRFERLSWLKEKLEQSNHNFDNISQSFHLLSSVEQIYGATPVEDKFEYSIYSIVYDMNDKKVYLKGYDDLNIKEMEL